MIDHNFHKIQKENLLHKINSSLNRICTTDIPTCNLGHCGYYSECYKKHDFTKYKKVRLKSIYKNLSSHENNQKGRRHPTNLGNNVFEIASTILGKSILEHELIINDRKYNKAIIKCRTMNQLVQILQRIRKIKLKKMTEVQELHAALLEAKKLIRSWHGMGIDPQAEQYMWNIYDRKSPEMIRINTILEKYKHLNPATGESGK